jgi:hypothetical protein
VGTASRSTSRERAAGSRNVSDLKWFFTTPSGHCGSPHLTARTQRWRHAVRRNVAHTGPANVMWHNVVLIGGVGLVASVGAWLLCRLSGYTVAAWVAPLAITAFCLGLFVGAENTSRGRLACPWYPTICTALTSRIVLSSPSCTVTLTECEGNSNPCCHSTAVPSRSPPPRLLKSPTPEFSFLQSVHAAHSHVPRSSQ